MSGHSVSRVHWLVTTQALSATRFDGDLEQEL
mgnify:CR=1 FL=1